MRYTNEQIETMIEVYYDNRISMKEQRILSRKIATALVGETYEESYGKYYRNNTSRKSFTTSKHKINVHFAHQGDYGQPEGQMCWVIGSIKSAKIINTKKSSKALGIEWSGNRYQLPRDACYKFVALDKDGATLLSGFYFDEAMKSKPLSYWDHGAASIKWSDPADQKLREQVQEWMSAQVGV